MLIASTCAAANSEFTNSLAWPSTGRRDWPSNEAAVAVADGMAGLKVRQTFGAFRTNGAALTGWSTNAFTYTIAGDLTFAFGWPEYGGALWPGAVYDFEHAIMSKIGVPAGAKSNAFTAVNTFTNAVFLHPSDTSAWDGVEYAYDYTAPALQESLTNRVDPVPITSYAPPLDGYRAYDLQRAMERRHVVIHEGTNETTLATASHLALAGHGWGYWGNIDTLEATGAASQNVWRVKQWIKANATSFADKSKWPFAGRVTIPMQTATGVCATVGAPTNLLEVTFPGDQSGSVGSYSTIYTVTLHFAVGQTNVVWRDYTGQGRNVTGWPGMTSTQRCTNAAILSGFTSADYGFKHLPDIFTQLTMTVGGDLFLTETAEANGSAADTTWAGAKTACEADGDGIGVGEYGNSIEAEYGNGTVGTYNDANDYSAARRGATFQLTTAADCWTNFPRAVHFFLSGTNFNADTTGTQNTWDDGGNNIDLGTLTLWETVSLARGAPMLVATSTVELGSVAVPTWCNEPTAGTPNTGRGWSVWRQPYVIEWTMP